MAAINLTGTLRLDANQNPEIVHWIPNRHFIADQKFNKARAVKPKQSLHGSIDEESVLSIIVGAILLRQATPEEKAEWKEIHANDDWFAAYPEDQRDSYIPNYIIADGFGRAEAHLMKHGNDTEIPMECKVAETQDQDEALILGVYMNGTSRSAHFLDQYAAFEAAKRKKAKQKDIAKMFNCSEAQVSTILKVCKQLTNKQIAKIVKEDTPFYKVERMINGNPDSNGSGGGGVKALPAGKRNLYINNCSKAVEEIGEEAEAVPLLNMLEFALRFAGGEFGEKSLIDAAHSCDILTDVDFDFEYDEEAEAAKAAKEAEREAKAKAKAEAKAAKEAEKAAKAKEREEAKAAKEAEKAAKKAAKEKEKAEKAAAKKKVAKKKAAKKKVAKKVSKKSVAGSTSTKKKPVAKKKVAKKKA